MTSPLQTIEAQAMQLTLLERAELAEKLWCSVHAASELDAAWQAEIERRAHEIDSGAVATLPWAEAMAALKAHAA